MKTPFDAFLLSQHGYLPTPLSKQIVYRGCFRTQWATEQAETKL